MKGAMGSLRKSIISFVSITDESSIDKQLREMVSWLSSQSMIHYYLVNLKDTFWPNDKLAPAAKCNDEATRQSNRFHARKLLSDNLPKILVNLCGEQNCKKGFAKVFDYLQYSKLNKQLIYQILESFLIEFVSNFKQELSCSQ